MKINNGFTLIELMIILMVISVLAAIAYPSYRTFLERKDLSQVKQEMLRISSELERFKNKNFSYKGFNAKYLYDGYNTLTGELYLPLGGTSTSALYKITVVDGTKKLPLNSNDATVLGQDWVIKAERVASSGTTLKQPKNYDLLLTSTGVRCMTRTPDMVKTYINCGSSNYETW